MAVGGGSALRVDHHASAAITSSTATAMKRPGRIRAASCCFDMAVKAYKPALFNRFAWVRITVTGFDANRPRSPKIWLTSSRWFQP